jgi:ATP-dependent RNA helicase RhlE
VLRSDAVGRAIVFTRTKHGANRISRRLEQVGIEAPAIHGNKSQNARERALGEFRTGKTRVLIATDIAARGIDVTDISHVINFDMPDVPEAYVHRVGRTGRAGASGQAISFCDRDERALLRDIERLLRKPLPVLEGGAFGVDLRAAAPEKRDGQPQRDGQAQRSGDQRPRSAAPGANGGARQYPAQGGRNDRRERSFRPQGPR